MFKNIASENILFYVGSMQRLGYRERISSTTGTHAWLLSLTYTLVFNGNNISLNRTSVSGLVLYLSVSVLHMCMIL